MAPFHFWLLTKYPSYTETLICPCSRKKNNFTRDGVLITIEVESNDLSTLQQMIMNFSEETENLYCRRCKEQSARRQINVRNHLLLEAVPPGTGNTENNDLILRPDQIPKQIRVMNSLFTLRGVISFISPCLEDMTAIGHFTAYCWRAHTDRFELYDDLQSSTKPIYVKATTMIKFRYL